MANEQVLVTGGSGFIGVHCILQLLEADYRVRTTVRSLQREPDVRAMLKQGGARASDQDRLSFIAANLENDAGWPEAVDRCDYVLHVASPIPPHAPKHEDELIIPAREGALRVLRASREAGVRRVVLTSSFGTIGYGHPTQTAPFSEKDWSNLDGDVPPYQKSKTLAERAAWDFIAREGGNLELSVINPVGVLGPVFGPDYSPSIFLVQRLMDRAMPGVHVILRKPVTRESGTRSLKTAYSRMLRDYRKHTRFALMTRVLAVDEKQGTFSVTVTNVGEGGVGLATNEELAVGSIVSFQLPLPGLKSEIHVEARVLWTRSYGVAGCEFVHFPTASRQILSAWLESRYRIKKPLIPV